MHGGLPAGGGTGDGQDLVLSEMRTTRGSAGGRSGCAGARPEVALGGSRTMQREKWGETDGGAGGDKKARK